MFNSIILWILMLGFSGDFSAVKNNTTTDGYGKSETPVQRTVARSGYALGG